MQILFVQGPEKTATSTLTGILNCHPEIFILFETYMAQPYITKYGNQLLDRYPEARHFFRSDKDYGQPVIDFFNYLLKVEPEYQYKYVGTKINDLDPGTTQKEKQHKIIFTKRDLRSWLIKESVIKKYRTDLDIVVPAVEYLRFIIESAKYSHACHMWMENLIEKNNESIDQLSEYLDLDLKPHTNHWWDKIGQKKDDNPKSVFRLLHVHHSSREKPDSLDTKYDLKKHPFWSDATQIFDKYYKKRDYSGLSEKEISSDLKFVDTLGKHSPLPFKNAYSHVRSIRIGFAKPQEVYFYSETDKEGNRRSIISKVKQRLKRIIDIGFNSYHISKGIAYGLIFYDEIQLFAEILLID